MDGYRSRSMTGPPTRKVRFLLWEVGSTVSPYSNFGGSSDFSRQPLCHGHPVRDEGTSSLRCDPTNKKHLRPHAP